MKIPFDIKYRPQIESGEYKVVTGDDRPVRIISWDKKVFGGRTEIVGLVPTSQGDTETVQVYYPNGTLVASGWNEKFKLFIVTPEPELTEFEKALIDLIADWGDSVEHFPSEFVKKRSHILLSLAKDQLRKDGFIVEKHNELFDECVANISDRLLIEMQTEFGCHVKHKDSRRYAELDWQQFQKVAQKFIDMGKAEALKDLPRWRKELGEMELAAYGIIGDGFLSQENPRVYLNGYSIDLYSLEKLPKED